MQQTRVSGSNQARRGRGGRQHRVVQAALLLALIAACDFTGPAVPSAGLVADWEGHGGDERVGGAFSVWLSVRDVSDSVRGVWEIAYQASRYPNIGRFAGVMDGDILVLHLSTNDCPGGFTVRTALRSPDTLGPGVYEDAGSCIAYPGVIRWVRHPSGTFGCTIYTGCYVPFPAVGVVPKH